MADNDSPEYPADAAPQRFRSRPVATVLVTAALSLPLLAAAQFIAHTRTDETDGWLYAYFGRQLVAGRLLYVELWDNKPPGIYWLNALGDVMSRDSRSGMIVLCAAAVLLTSVAAFVLVRRLTGSWVGAGSACVLVSLYVQNELYHVGANRPATFVIAAEMWAIVFYVRAYTGRRSWLALLAAGVLAGTALLFKQTALAVPIAIGVHQLGLSLPRSQRWRRSAATVAVGVLGISLPLGLGIFALSATSDLTTAYESVIRIAVSYFDSETATRLRPRLLDLSWQMRLLALPLILSAAGLICAIGDRRRSGETRDLRAGFPLVVTLLATWFAAALYLAAVAPNPKPHYFGPVLPPLVILAAYGLGRVIASSAGAGWKRYHVWVALLWSAYMMIAPIERQFSRMAACYHWTYVDPSADSVASIVAIIQAHTEPSDPIFVVGYRPEIYYRASRPPACRFMGIVSAEQQPAGGQAVANEIVEVLTAYPPKIIVADRRAIEAMMISDANSAGDDLDFSGLADLLELRYTPDGDEPSVWVRN